MSRSTVSSVKPKEAYNLIIRGSILIDVRDLSEWDAGHAPTAIHIPLAMLEQNIARIPKDNKVLVCCRSGNRSSQATKVLNNLGFQVANVVGGMSQWDSDGLPVVNNNGTRGSIK